MKHLNKIILLFTIFLSNSNLSAQVETDITGYYHNLPIAQIAGEDYANTFDVKKFQLLDLNRLRLRPTIYLGDNSRLNIEYELAALIYSSSQNISSFHISQSDRQLYSLSWALLDQNNVGAIHFIDRLSYRHDFNWGSITAGRQRISWGTGRIWNPTDLFNPINPASFFKTEKDGADAISSKISLGNFTDLNIVFNPVNKFESANFGGRFRTNFNEFDVSFVSGYFDNNIIVGGDFAGNLSDAGIRGEMIYSKSDNTSENDYVKFILGADYQFTAELYTLIEFQHNGRGKSNISEYELQKLTTGEIINLGQDYIYLMAMYQLGPLVNISLGNNLNINDKSGFFLFSASYSASDNIYLNFGTQYSYGKINSEYWYYPPSIFSQIEYYF